MVDLVFFARDFFGVVVIKPIFNCGVLVFLFEKPSIVGFCRSLFRHSLQFVRPACLGVETWIKSQLFLHVYCQGTVPDRFCQSPSFHGPSPTQGGRSVRGEGGGGFAPVSFITPSHKSRLHPFFVVFFFGCLFRHMPCG